MCQLNRKMHILSCYKVMIAELFNVTKKYFYLFTLMALMADFVTDIILARDIGGFMSIMENNLLKKREEKSISSFLR